MAYFTEAELEALTAKTFTTLSKVSTIQIGLMATEISNMFDGFMQQSTGSETPDEYVTHACLACAVYTIGQIYAGEPIDPLMQEKLLKQFMVPFGKQMSYGQEYPDSTGSW